MVFVRKAASSSSAPANLPTKKRASNDVKDDGKNKHSKHGRKTTIIFGLLIAGGATAIWYVVLTTTATTMTMKTTMTAPPIPINPSTENKGNDAISVPSAAVDTVAKPGILEKYESCTVDYVPPQITTSKSPEEEWRKPFLVPAYPASGSSSPSKKGDIIKKLIDSMTGSKSSTKNYHMSVRNKLRRCKGMSETVACSQGHPYVSINIEDQTENFQRQVIFVMRNFITAFPASHTDKGIAYHNAKGQAPEDEWNKVRDEYISTAFQSWADMIHWWRKTSSYDVGLYVSYERLMDDSEVGLDTVRQLHQLISDGGFDVAPSQDIPCLWAKAVRDMKIHEQKVSSEYQPGYTRKQQQFLLDEYEKLIQQVSDDIKLVSILKEHVVEIRDKTRLLD